VGGISAIFGVTHSVVFPYPEAKVDWAVKVGGALEEKVRRGNRDLPSFLRGHGRRRVHVLGFPAEAH
jgi:hypothetical protein